MAKKTWIEIETKIIENIYIRLSQNTTEEEEIKKEIEKYLNNNLRLKGIKGIKGVRIVIEVIKEK